MQLHQFAQASDQRFCPQSPGADPKCQDIHSKYQFWRRRKLPLEHASQALAEGPLPLQPSQVINAQLLDAQPQPAGLIKAVRNRHVEDSSPHVPKLLSGTETKALHAGLADFENSRFGDRSTDWWAFL